MLLTNPNGATIDGTVQNGKQEPLGGVIVLLRNAAEKDTVGESTSTTDQNGKFYFHGLAPGKYTLIAKRRGKPKAQENPAEANVSLSEGEKKSVTIKVE